MPRLSICIPAYRQIEYLRETLLSLEKQSFRDYELIITDDSPDDSVERLLGLFNFNGKLQYYKNSVPLGSPENWNEAVRYAKGDYIKILHHDDRFAHSGALESFVRLLDENPEANFAFCASHVEDAASGKDWVHCATQTQIARIRIRPEELIMGNIIGAPSATIYRNGCGIEYDTAMKWLVDIDFYIRMMEQNPQFVCTSEALIVTPTNVIHQVTEVCKNNALIELSEYLHLYKKIEGKVKDLPNIYRMWFRLFEKYRVYSQQDFDRLLVDPALSRALLPNFFVGYKAKYLARFPYRLYVSLPISVKTLIRRIRSMF